MRRYLVVNPNTSTEMTSSIKSTIDQVAEADIEVDVINVAVGLPSLESFYDYNIAAAAVSYTLDAAKIAGYDGVLLACFGDPGLYGLKEMISAPVIGIAEAALSVSLLLGYKFAIIVALDKATPMMTNLVQQYGLSQRLAGVYALDISVLGIEENRARSLDRMLHVGSQAVAAGAEVLILGCAGMTGFATAIENELKVTVIDPVSAGFTMLHAIVTANLRTSRNGLYKTGPLKDHTGMGRLFRTDRV